MNKRDKFGLKLLICALLFATPSLHAQIMDDSCCVLPGDVNHDGSVNIEDVTYYIAWMFEGGEAPICFEEADHTGDCSLDISDLTAWFFFLFSNGPASAPCQVCPKNSIQGLREKVPVREG